MNDRIDSKFEVVWSKKDSRHLGATSEGRRLRSSFDVFDFVNNAIDAGVNEAKKNNDAALKVNSKDIEKTSALLKKHIDKGA